MIADKLKKGKPKGSTNKNNQSPPAIASTTTPLGPLSSRETPRMGLQAGVAAAAEGSVTSYPPSRDKSGSVYRLALGSAGIAISEGFLTCHSKLPEPVKSLLEPIACIPQSVKKRVSSRLLPSLTCLVPYAMFKCERRILLYRQAFIS